MKTYSFLKHVSIAVLLLVAVFSCKIEKRVKTNAVFCTHKVVLDDQGKIVPWYSPAEKAYDHFLRLRWNFIKTRVPNSPGPDPQIKISPILLLLCIQGQERLDPVPDTWMNDIGEKIPNWFE